MSGSTTCSSASFFPGIMHELQKPLDDAVKKQCRGTCPQDIDPRHQVRYPALVHRNLFNSLLQQIAFLGSNTCAHEVSKVARQESIQAGQAFHLHASRSDMCDAAHQVQVHACLRTCPSTVKQGILRRETGDRQEEEGHKNTGRT